jgi:hypothetical protein
MTILGNDHIWKAATTEAQIKSMSLGGFRFAVISIVKSNQRALPLMKNKPAIHPLSQSLLEHIIYVLF